MAERLGFFEQQDLARRNSRRLMVWFALALLVVVAGIDIAIVGALFGMHSYAQELEIHAHFPWGVYGDLTVVLSLTSLATVLVIGLASAWKWLTLTAGGAPVAESLGGRILQAGALQDAQERRLLNVVEEMALASGLAVPPIYVLDHEPGINAFAAGLRPADAVIGVTRGSLDRLNRDQLQGVIGHEFSHILNGDMRLNLRIMGLLHGLLFLGLAGRLLLRMAPHGRDSSNDRDSQRSGAPLVVIGLALWIMGYLGLFLGRLIQAALSREREFLADASAVQFTRNPVGLADALKIIGGSEQHSVLSTPQAEETAHLFFSDALKRWLVPSPFATHPPLAVRIQRLDRHWDGASLPLADAETSRPASAVVEPAVSMLTDPSPPAAKQPSVLDDSPPRSGHDALERSLQQLGHPGSEPYAYAREFLQRVTPEISGLVHEPLSAACVVLHLLRQDGPTSPAITGSLPAEFAAEFVTVAGKLDRFCSRFPVDLIKLAMPALRRLSPAQYQVFRTTVIALIDADRRLSFREWMIRRLTVHNLDQAFHPVSPNQSGKSGTADDLACAIVLSAVAWSGTTGEQASIAANHAFAVAQRTLGESTRRMAGIELIPRDEIRAGTLDDALNGLARRPVRDRVALIRAVGVCIAADGHLGAKEFNLARVIADALDCPLPPHRIPQSDRNSEC